MADADYTNETWKTIPFAPNYAVSDMGRVKRITDALGKSPARAGFVLKQSIRATYPSVTLTTDGRPQHFNTHRVVAIAFLPNPDNHRVVAHIDGDNFNNSVGNLKWCTQAENIADKVAHGTQVRGSAVSHAKLTADMVRAIRADTRFEKAIGRSYGISQAHVNRIRLRKVWAWLD